MYKPLLSYLPNSQYGYYEDLIAQLKAKDLWEFFIRVFSESEAANEAYNAYLEYVNHDNSVHTQLKLRELADKYNSLWRAMAEDALGIKKSSLNKQIDVEAANVNIFFATSDTKQTIRELKEMVADYGIEDEVADAVLAKNKDLYVNLSIALDKYRRGTGDKQEVTALQNEYNDLWVDAANDILFSEAALHNKLKKIAITMDDIGCKDEELQPVERPSQMREDDTTNSYALGLEKNNTSDKNSFSYKLNILHPTPSLPFGSNSLLGKDEKDVGTRGANTTSEGDLVEKVEMNFPPPYMFAHAAPDMVHLKTKIGYNYKGDQDDNINNPGMGVSMATIPSDRNYNEVSKQTIPSNKAAPGAPAPSIKQMEKMYDKNNKRDKDIDEAWNLNPASQIECESSVKGNITPNVKQQVTKDPKGKVTDDGSGTGTAGTRGARGTKSVKASMDVNEPVSDGISQWDQPVNYKEPTDIKLFLNKNNQGNGLSLNVFKPTYNKDDYSRNMSGIGNGDAPGCINQGLNKAFNMGGDLGEIGDKALGNNADAQHTEGVDVTKIGKEEQWDTDPQPQVD